MKPLVMLINDKFGEYIVKKGWQFSRPQPGCHLLNSPWRGIIKLFPTRERLVSDIPVGDEKIANLFLQCTDYQLIEKMMMQLTDGEFQPE
jgi:hypothetical protein